MTAQKINIYLKALRGSTDHQKMFSSIDQITQMQQIFMETAPPQLAKFCSLGQLSDGKLTVLVGNGGIAAKLKQILPSLLLSLQG
ncbi:MAG: DciA family protein, partial [Nitrosomonadaceae bacterium]|nr:DciA family protein [Nitrosomonadaceae bacterium]